MYGSYNRWIMLQAKQGTRQHLSPELEPGQVGWLILGHSDHTHLVCADCGSAAIEAARNYGLSPVRAERLGDKDVMAEQKCVNCKQYIIKR